MATPAVTGVTVDKLTRRRAFHVLLALRHLPGKSGGRRRSIPLQTVRTSAPSSLLRSPRVTDDLDRSTDSPGAIAGQRGDAAR
jgi:hypothetical protein